MLVVRAARKADHARFIDLARAAGPGFTSLSVSDEALGERLELSEKSFAGDVTDKASACFQIMLEDTETGEVAGTAAVKPEIGIKKPFFDFKIFTLAQASKEADRRFDMDAMLLVNDFAGATEVGSLFVADTMRGRGAGRLVAQSRYMLMNSDRDKFGDRVLAELRGVVDRDGFSIFYEHVTRPFFQMSFNEVDHLSANSDNQFIVDLMPVHPIYIDLLPKEVREVIGKTHPDGKNARALLEWEGFSYDRYIDIFDGGPLVSCKTDNLRTIRDSLQLRLGHVGDGLDVQALVSNDRLSDFRVIITNVRIKDDIVSLSDEAARVLNLMQNETCRIWIREI